MLKLIFFQLICKSTTLFSHTLIYISFYDLLTRKIPEPNTCNRQAVAYSVLIKCADLCKSVRYCHIVCCRKYTLVIFVKIICGIMIVNNE